MIPESFHRPFAGSYCGVADDSSRCHRTEQKQQGPWMRHFLGHRSECRSALDSLPFLFRVTPCPSQFISTCAKLPRPDNQSKDSPKQASDCVYSHQTTAVVDFHIFHGANTAKQMARGTNGQPEGARLRHAEFDSATPLLSEVYYHPREGNMIKKSPSRTRGA